ncbi:MAG: DNA-processing protein DprA [Myxococcota bacterium]
MLRFDPVAPAAYGLTWPGPLFLAGQVPRMPRLAIIGSRAAHRRFTDCVPGLVRAAAETGYALVSGGAVGIDAAAHRAALDLGVAQVAVLPGPPDALYPPDHEPLFEAIVDGGGAVLCPHPPGTVTSRGMFASRNALVVQLSAAVVGVQAGARSGTRGTLRLALRAACRTAGIVGSPGVAWALGAGATSLGPPRPELVQACALAWLREEPTHRAWPAALSWIEQALSQRPAVTVDDFDDPLAAAVALVEAEAGGWVAEVAPGRYVRAG